MRSAFMLATFALVLAFAAVPPNRQRDLAAAPPTVGVLGAAPIVIPDCRLTVFEKQEVPSRRSGTLLLIGTEIAAGETVPPDQLIAIQVGKEEKKYRRLRVGDPVRAGQLLGLLDDELTRHEHGIKTARLAASQAELETAVRTCEEARRRFETQLNLQKQGKGIIADEDVRASKLTWERAYFDEASHRQAVAVAALEVSQLESVQRMHEVRASIAGVIKAIHKRAGEAVRESETLLEIQNLARLRVEGQVDVQHLPRLRQGMKPTIEWTRPLAPRLTLNDHLQEVTAVAVSRRNGKLQIVSASADGTVRVWDPLTRQATRVLQHPAGVQSVDCLSSGSAANLCLTGAADGKARLWNLDASSEDPGCELSGQHRGGIQCVAFSPDGMTCITGGEDREIWLWDCATGKLRYRFPVVHGGGITALQFIAPDRLLSVSRDNTLRLWQVQAQAARLEATLDRRTGDVSRLNASGDGRQVLFDQGKALRLRTLPEGLSVGRLDSGPSGSPFSTLALLSPNGHLVLTVAGGEDGLQLWRAPGPGNRARKLRSLTCPDASAVTSACFAPDGSFVVAGTRDGRVLVWSVPVGMELAQPQTGEITLIERTLEASTRQVRIWAEFDNADGALLAGSTVTLIVDPPAGQ
jgi:WD40 repeat protein